MRVCFKWLSPLDISCVCACLHEMTQAAPAIRQVACGPEKQIYSHKGRIPHNEE